MLFASTFEKCLFHLSVQTVKHGRGGVEGVFELRHQNLKLSELNPEQLKVQFDVTVRTALQHGHSDSQVLQFSQENIQFPSVVDKLEDTHSSIYIL